MKFHLNFIGIGVLCFLRTLSGKKGGQLLLGFAKKAVSLSLPLQVPKGGGGNYWENPLHVRALESIQNKSIPIVCLDGVAGTGKTMMAVMEGLDAVMRKDYDSLVLTRPYLGAGREMGFLKGDLQTKMHPFIIPMLNYIQEWEEERNLKFPVSKMKIFPLGFMRGQTFKRCFVIADEMSNSTPEEMRMLLTRIGEHSKMVLTGDFEQSDLETPNKEKNGWVDLKNRLLNHSSIFFIAWHHFDESCIRRHGMLSMIHDLYKD